MKPIERHFSYSLGDNFYPELEPSCFWMEMEMQLKKTVQKQHFKTVFQLVNWFKSPGCVKTKMLKTGLALKLTEL